MNRNYIYMALLLVGAVSCAVREDELSDTSSKKVKIELVATIVGQDTKTYMGGLDTENNIYPILWSEGDEIGLIESSSKTIDVALTDGYGTNRATFGGNVEDIVAPFTGTSIYPAAYPADNAFADASNPNTIFVGSYLPVKQTFKNGSFNDNVYPMAAVSNDGFKYDFYNLGAVIQLKIQASEEGQALRAIYLTGNDDEVIAGGIGMHFDKSSLEPVESELDKDGPFKANDYDARFKTATFGSEAYQRVIVDFDGGELPLSTSSPVIVNIAVLPQTFAHGFKIEMVDANNFGSTIYESQDNITLARSCVKSMRTITYLSGEPLEVANSYIYEDEGYYIMPAYAMGNRLGVNFDNTGKDVDVALLWSDVVKEGCPGITADTSWLKPAVTNIEYIKFEDGYNMLQFRVNENPDTKKPYRGNAAIALYDRNTNEIIWSWHIWMTDTVYETITGGSCTAGSYTGKYPDGSDYVYEGEAANGNMIIMDRNLGAISANPDDGWKTYGLYYQNGRRDPFIGAHWNGNASAGTATAFTSGEGDALSVREDESTPFSHSETHCWYNEKLARMNTYSGWSYHPDYLTVSEALKYPLVFSSAYEKTTARTDVTMKSAETNGNGQWTWYEYWDNKTWLDFSMQDDYPGYAGKHGYTGLTDGEHESYWNRTKTIMDPCPVGYSLLGDNSDFLGKDSYTIAANSVTGMYGMTSKHTYNSRTFTTWWPAAGVRTITGKLGAVGYQGLYFHYDHISATHGGHGTAFSGGNNRVSTDFKTNHAGSVRCVREKQFNDLSKYPIKVKPE